MPFVIEAACGCHTGKIRKNNEDNFYFDGRVLEAENSGLPHPASMTCVLRREICVAVFDGMGGENFGEEASFAAADCMQKMPRPRRLKDRFVPESRLLADVCGQLNRAVVEKAAELCTEHMGSTVVGLWFSRSSVSVCNLGDSRAYRLRDGKFTQISVDHVEKREGQTKKKMPLTQHLGIDPEICLIEPYIAKDKLKCGDQYLLCSDGLTDMLTDPEIEEILKRPCTTEDTVRILIDKALENGGRDNVTVIVCRIR